MPLLTLKVKEIRKIISIIILVAFVGSSIKMPAFAQTSASSPLLHLPVAGVRVHLSPEFVPAHLEGMVIHPENALRFDFIIHRGDEPLSNDQKQAQYKKLVKYFLASLTILKTN